MALLPLRLPPGVDLKSELLRHVVERRWSAAMVLSGIGSLAQTRLRLAGQASCLELSGPVEILTLAGTLGADGAHLHAAVADADGRVVGGHVGAGCIIRTTAEVLLLEARGWQFSRQRDPATGFDELVVRRHRHPADRS